MICPKCMHKLVKEEKINTGKIRVTIVKCKCGYNNILISTYNLQKEYHVLT